MEDILKQRANNFYVLGLLALQREMPAESISNFFKALFAVCDLDLFLFGFNTPLLATIKKEYLKMMVATRKNLPIPRSLLRLGLKFLVIFILFIKIKLIPKNHDERFEMLRKHSTVLYVLLDNLFLTYRQTYTQTLSKPRAEHIRSKINEAFKYAGLNIPTV